MSLRLIAGASLQLAGRCASCRGTGSGCCTWLFHIKQKYCIHQHAFLWSNIQHSTFPHLLRRWSALSLQNGKRVAFFPSRQHTKMRLRLIVHRNPSQISGLAGLWPGAVQSFRDGRCNKEKILYNTKQKSRTNVRRIRSAFLLLHYSSIQSTFYEKAMCNIHPSKVPEELLRICL